MLRRCWRAIKEQRRMVAVSREIEQCKVLATTLTAETQLGVSSLKSGARPGIQCDIDISGQPCY